MSTNFVVGNPRGSSLPGIRSARHSITKPSTQLNPAAAMGLRSTNIAAAARTELNARPNFKTAAFDDWFKAAFDGDGTGKSTDSLKPLKSVKAKTLLAQKEAELKKLNRPKPLSKAIPSLKRGLPRFASETKSSKGSANVSPKSGPRPKRSPVNSKREKLAQRSRRRAAQGTLPTLDVPRKSGNRQGPRQKVVAITRPRCAGEFCKVRGKRDNDTALILKQISNRVVIEYKMFMDRRVEMNAQERSSVNSMVQVCQKCYRQYKKLAKIKGWKSDRTAAVSSPQEFAMAPSSTRGSGFRKMRPDVLDMKRRDRHRKQRKSKELRGSKSPSTKSSIVEDAALRSRKRHDSRRAQIADMGHNDDRHIESASTDGDSVVVGYDYRDGKHHQWRKVSPSRKPSEPAQSQSRAIVAATSPQRSPDRNATAGPPASRAAVARAKAKEHGRALFSPTRRSGQKTKKTQPEQPKSPPAIMGCELCDCSCYVPNGFLLNRCDTCAHAKKLHTINNTQNHRNSSDEHNSNESGPDRSDMPITTIVDGRTSPLKIEDGGVHDLEQAGSLIKQKIAQLEKEEKARQAERDRQRKQQLHERLVAEAEQELLRQAQEQEATSAHNNGHEDDQDHEDAHVYDEELSTDQAGLHSVTDILDPPSPRQRTQVSTAGAEHSTAIVPTGTAFEQIQDNRSRLHAIYGQQQQVALRFRDDTTTEQPQPSTATATGSKHSDTSLDEIRRTLEQHRSGGAAEQPVIAAIRQRQEAIAKRFAKQSIAHTPSPAMHEPQLARESDPIQKLRLEQEHIARTFARVGSSADNAPTSVGVVDDISPYREAQRRPRTHSHCSDTERSADRTKKLAPTRTESSTSCDSPLRHPPPRSVSHDDLSHAQQWLREIGQYLGAGTVAMAFESPI